MSREEGEKIDRGHREKKRALRVLGPLILITGIILFAIGIIGTFSGFKIYNSFSGNPFGPFLLAFVGVPLIGIGSWMTRFGYMGAVFRYAAGETAPVITDTLNYVAKDTSEGLTTAAESICKGLGKGMTVAKGGTTDQTLIRCYKCNEENPADSKFCKSCGASLLKTEPCPHCGELNDPDARFCDNCGKPLK